MIESLINTVIQEDCLNIMKSMPDKCVDLILTDPPYGIGNFVRTTSRGKKINRPGVLWNNRIPSKIYFEEMKRISKNQIIFGANYFNCFDESGGAIVWYKNMGHPDYSQCEIASASMIRTVDFIRIDWNVCRHRLENIVHPCQRPVSLFYLILQKYAAAGMTIFDPFAGSGAVAIACLESDLDYVLVEQDDGYVDIINKRILAWTEQGKLFPSHVV